MDMMEQYKIRKSIEDVIGILDSAPIRPDMIQEVNYVQLTNRVPIAHLAIERGLKALISDAGGNAEETHALNRLHKDLKKSDQDSAAYLEMAFEDAVRFFGYNVNRKGFRQFRSLDDYLSKVGTENAFEELRYWAIGEPSKGESPIPYISPPIHRELLCALACLFLNDDRPTVSDRVEREVSHAMFHGRHLIWRSDDTSRRDSIHWYWEWLSKGHATRRDALNEAMRSDFIVREDDEFITETLREAYNDLIKSKDPAVRYYISRLTYLPKGSQSRNPDAMPIIEWLNQQETSGMVGTPAGTTLGFVDKYPDGGWGITPQEEGLVQVADIAENLADAKNYLVNRLTNKVTVTTNGERKVLRIASERDFFPTSSGWLQSIEDLEGPDLDKSTYELDFWDAFHGITPGETISIELLPTGDQGFASVLDGTVISVQEQKVSIRGAETFKIVET